MRKQNFGQIISGELKGRKICFSKSKNLRPTRRVVRESIFSTVFSQVGHFENLRILDAFCGSGLLGLEFLSRGAAYVDFVDKDNANWRQFQENVKPFNHVIENRYTFWHGSVIWFLDHLDATKCWDVAWYDPPYRLFPEDEIHAILESKRCNLFGIHVEAQKYKPYERLFKQYEPKYTMVYRKTFGQSSIFLLRSEEEEA